MVENRPILNKFMYYFLSWTWGFIMSFIGLIVITTLKVYLKLTGQSSKLQTWGYSKYLAFGSGWGGLEFGMWFLMDDSNYTPLKDHEFGHGVQNCWWGPFTLFVIFLPSSIRYWLRNFESMRSKRVFSGIITLVTWTVSVILLFIGFAFNSISLYIISSFIFIYFLIIALWLNLKEIPQYATNNYIDYDAIWFEGDATRTGAKYISKLENK